MDDSFSKMLEKFGQQCGERSSSSIGNQQDASGDDEDEEEEEEEQEESEEETEEEISDIRKRIKKRAETQKARLQAAKSPIDEAQEKAKSAASKMHKLIMKANNVKINTARTKDNKDVMLRVAENIKELEATRRVLCRLSGAKKAHLSHTLITHASYTRIIHTYHTHASYTRIAKNFHAQVSNTHKMKMHHMR